MELQKIFKNADEKQNNLLTRVFGIFSEEIINCWLAYPDCEYKNLGRPSIYKKNERPSTLDFLFEKKKGTNKGALYIVEQKCLFSYNKGNLLCMTETNLEHFEKWSTQKAKYSKAWKDFREIHSYLKNEDVVIKWKGSTPELTKKVVGNILIWGKWMDNTKHADPKIDKIISMESIMNEMNEWDNLGVKSSGVSFKEFILSKKKLVNNMFNELVK